MKAYTIDTGAAWVATLQTWQDGDVFGETNTDIVADSIADRLGYLKTQVDGKASLAGATNVWTGLNTFQSGGGGATSGAKFYREVHFASEADSTAEAQKTCILYRGITMADADTTYPPYNDHYRVPTITANRTYKFNAHDGNNGRTIRITKANNANFTTTIQDASSVTIAVFSSGASSQAWIEIQYSSSTSPAWRVSAWGGTVTTLATV